MRRSYIIAAAAVIIVVVVAVAVVLLMNPPGSTDQNNSPGTTGGNSVDIKNLAFSPTPLNVTVGTTVTWTNNDSTPHTVTSTFGPVFFDSGRMEAGDTFSFTFTKAGTYDYVCTIHPFMNGQVIVT